MGVFEGAFPEWAYLIGYNTVSALLWLSISTWTALTAAVDGLDQVYASLRVVVLFTQTLAALEIVHAAIGLVHAPVLTTFVQVAGRLTVLWIVIEAYPAATQQPYCIFYASMVLCWGLADVIRYLYFATRLVGGHQYRRLIWLRYSAFYVLYPIGIASEVGVVAQAVKEAWQWGNHGHAWAYMAAATLYLPAAPTLFNHMRRQRRKVLAPSPKK
ncbi:tyrosine phosphatase-like protein [Coniella lustricola]|uniref:Very-long-chain (3R)-3-hydroxyacyl-CoA dehydratase n=1 Tax=Coniella lustricola TaxID=2025994 RepID=A0A2T3ANT1_9PEZI|nr:tyrosine phosphatase-like protein [Coniella lustricola]